MTDPRVAALVANRSLSTPAQVRAFDAALIALGAEQSAELLDELHLVLIDDTDDHEVMWGLLHLLEARAPDAQLASMFRVLPALADQAPEWVMTLHYRIINSADARSRYAVVLAEATAAAVAAAVDILEVIAEDTEPALRDGARELLFGIARLG